MADLGAIGTYRGSLTARAGTRTLIYRHDSIPAAFPLTVSGTVLNDAGAGAARTVRLYDRAYGVLLSETISVAGSGGAYSLPAPAVADVPEVIRIALDDDAGTLYNDIVDRVIPG